LNVMKRVWMWMVAAMLLLGGVGPAQAGASSRATWAAQATSIADPAAHVDPFIGTGPAPGTGYGLEFDGGDVFPGAAYPTGMLAWSPDTVEHRIPGGYDYPDHTIGGFSLTHFSGRGCTVYQDVPIMPIVGELAVSPRSRPTLMPATFSHANESAAPGYYAVTLDDGINAQLTVTPRTGIGAITFPGGSSAGTGTVVINAGGSVNDTFDSQVVIDPARQLVTGYTVSQVGCGTDRYTLYFAIAFDRPFTSYGTWAEDQLQTGATSAKAAHSGAYLTFDTTNDRRAQLKPAISYVSIDNALANLQTEDPGWDFAGVRDAARAAWNNVLDLIDVSDASNTADLTVFYTALYHTFFHPTIFSDANGDYIGFDDQVHHVSPGHAHYHNIPGWDQYRSLIQLRAILAPNQASDIIQSLVDDAEQGGGGMPRWEQANRNSDGMVGDSPGAYVSNAYAFGAREFDAQAALAALDFGASVVGATSGGHPVREYGEAWMRLGYVPDQPSITLEYATDDFAIAQFAHALGSEDLSARYMQRAANWVYTFNPQTGYVESRDAGGNFTSSDHASACCGFVEGNAAQYTWMVPFDYARLFDLLGGKSVAIERLDQFFSQVNAGEHRPYAWIGNEPSLDSPWVYDFAGAPSRTQAVVRQIQRSLFIDSPGGMPGNDDGGTISAWYVFSALGLYPEVPGVGGFAIGSPMFASAVVHVGNGQVLHIIGDGAAADAPYVQSLMLDGSAWESSWIDWSRLANGATLEFTLAAG
jgi:predicted alpha-1,2-mannosidase